MIHPNLNNGEWFVTEDSFSPNMSKNSMGTFFHHVLAAGAHIGSIWAFDPRFKNSLVLVQVYMTKEMKVKIEFNTKFKFRYPPIIGV